jgi:hypothetical protein
MLRNTSNCLDRLWFTFLLYQHQRVDEILDGELGLDAGTKISKRSLWVIALTICSDGGKDFPY